jgi:hypothetical protein
VVDIQPDRATRRHRHVPRWESSTVASENEILDDDSNFQAFNAMHHTYAGGSLPPVDILGPTIRSVAFEMALFSEPQVPIHTYTSIQSELGAPPQALDDVRDWRTMFPQLAAYRGSGDAECPMFLFETQLNLMNRYPGGSCKLGAEFFIDFTHGTAFTEWCSLTRFYEDNGSEIDLSKYGASNVPPNSPYDEIGCQEVQQMTDMRLEIPMKSKWWAQLFSDLMVEARRAAVGNPQIVKEEDQRTRQYLREMSVMQELWATSRNPGSQPQRMAILLWRFDQTRNREAPTTSWRPIVPPVSPFQVQSPSPSMLQVPHALDSNLEDPMAPHLTHPYPDFYNPQPSIFVDTSETLLALGQSEGSSPGTPQTDYRSFPSSTSTSFPSSISNSTYGIHQSQELSRDSQDSGYPVFGTFDSQDSTYVAAHSQESYGSQDNIYHSQDSLYHTVTTPLYEYPVHEYPAPRHDPPEEVTAIHDFTGGEIQLLYAPHAEPAPAYEAPLIAPRANMMPQSQVIEHLENFEYHDAAEHHQELEPDQSDLQQTYAEHFSQQNIDLNLLATQFNAWEDHNSSQQEIEHHVGGHVVEGLQEVAEYESQPESQQDQGEEQRAVMRQGDSQVRETPLESQLEYQ